MKTVKIENLIEGLREIPDADFTCDNVYRFSPKIRLMLIRLRRIFIGAKNFTRAI
jgi:hypothetical protein